MILQLEILFGKLGKMEKFYKLMLLVIIFSFILMLFPNSDFTGLNKIEKEVTGTLTAEDIDETIHLNIHNLFDRFYFSLITAVGIGYGDIVPKTFRLRFANAVFIFFVIYLTLL
jgi:hypothetical protein